MIPFFVGYALVVWYFAAKHRREWLGLLAVGLGMLGLLAMNYAHWKIGRWTAMRDPEGRGVMLPVLQALMYPYTALVVLLGVFITAMPKTNHSGCFRCGYDISGIDVKRCPECGEPLERAYRASGTDRSDLRASDVPGELPEEEPKDQPDPQDGGGKPEQQRPPEDREL